MYTLHGLRSVFVCIDCTLFIVTNTYSLCDANAGESRYNWYFIVT